VEIFQRITSGILVALLVFVTGLSSAAHGAVNDCTGGHCDAQAMAMPAGAHHVDHASSGPGGGVPLGHDSASHEGCGPYLCHVLALSIHQLAATVGQAGIVLGWPVARLSALKEPDGLDRPPNH